MLNYYNPIYQNHLAKYNESVVKSSNHAYDTLNKSKTGKINEIIDDVDSKLDVVHLENEILNQIEISINNDLDLEENSISENDSYRAIGNPNLDEKLVNDFKNHLKDGLDYFSIKTIIDKCANKMKIIKECKRNRNLRKRIKEKNKYDILELEGTFMDPENIIKNTKFEINEINNEDNKIKKLKAGISANLENIIDEKNNKLDLGIRINRIIVSNNLKLKPHNSFGNYEKNQSDSYDVDHKISSLFDIRAHSCVPSYNKFEASNLRLERNKQIFYQKPILCN